MASWGWAGRANRGNASGVPRGDSDRCGLGELVLPLQPLGLVGHAKGVDQLVQSAVEYLFQPVQGELDSMVRHASLREVVGPDLCASIAGAHLVSSVLRGLLLLLLDGLGPSLGTADRPLAHG